MNQRNQIVKNMDSNDKIHQVLPKDYESVKSLMLCSNKLIDFKFIINDNKFIPILIGDGLIPRIWIYAKSTNKSISVIRDNVSNLPNIKINIYSKENRISIEHLTNGNENNIVLDLNYKEEIPVVLKMDLRPIGYNIYGDITGLNIGNSKMTDNTFQGVENFIVTGK